MTELRDFTATAVVVGRLNPLIFSPEWLHSNSVIGPEEAAVAREHGIEVMAPNITSLVLGSMKLIVEEERFLLTVSDEPLIRAKDFAASCFRLLAHTPVFAVGLNFNALMLAGDVERWHRFGDAIAPKQPWGDFTEDNGGKRAGGVRALVMERSQGLGGHHGYTRIAFQVVDGAEHTANLQVNNHFNLAHAEAPSSGAEAYKLIEEIWDEAYERSLRLLKTIKESADAA